MAEKRRVRQAAKEPFLEFQGWRDSLMRAMRARDLKGSAPRRF